MLAKGFTCTDGDGADELLPPAAAPHHQGQVGLLDQLIYCVLHTRVHVHVPAHEDHAGREKRAIRYEVRRKRFSR